MWMVAASFRQTHSPSRLTWSEGWQPPCGNFGHDGSTINIAVVIIIIIIIIIGEYVQPLSVVWNIC